MRRKDREITDINKIFEVIDKCTYCRLGFYDDGEIYIVPLNFGYKRHDNSMTMYFHSANEGRKLDLIAKNSQVGFEMDTGYRLKSENSEQACTYTAEFESIIGNGISALVEKKSEKIEAFNLIMKQSTGKENWKFDEELLNFATIFKVEVSKMSCKIHE